MNFRLTSEKEQALAKIGLIAGPAIVGSVIGGFLYYAATGIRPAHSAIAWVWFVVPMSVVLIWIASGTQNLPLRVAFATMALTNLASLFAPLRGLRVAAWIVGESAYLIMGACLTLGGLQMVRDRKLRAVALAVFLVMVPFRYWSTQNWYSLMGETRARAALTKPFPTSLRATVTPPNGYRFPTEADYRGDWLEFRKQLPVPFHAEADFNGDALPDDAWILLRRDDPGWGVFVFLGRRLGSPRLMTLEEVSGDVPIHRHGISVVPPGRYQTACGKGYWDCKADESESLTFKLPAINFFVYESANSYFWWDPRAEAFKQTSISD